MKNADIAMYETKKHGRNTHFFTEELNDAVLRIINLDKEMRNALKITIISFFINQSLYKTSKIIGAEALIRWIHPEKGFIAPNRVYSFS